MSRRDVFHDAVRRALEKEGWIITHDPYSLAFGGRNLFVDLGAEMPLAAEKEGRKIAVEVKSFAGKSEVVEFEKAVGQFILYDVLVSDYEPDRTLLLAVPEDVWVGLFSEEQSVKVIERGRLRFVVYNPFKEEIVLWKE